MPPTKAISISKIEKPEGVHLHMVIKAWGKPCRRLYKKMGVYSLHNRAGWCLYVGQSTNLGKRILRFFNLRNKGRFYPVSFDNDCGISDIKYFGEELYLEVDTINNIHLLDRFERTMIGIKKPHYNILLNYAKPRGRTQYLNTD